MMTPKTTLSTLPRTGLRLAALPLLSLLLLAACGGGGSSSPTTTQPGPIASAPPPAGHVDAPPQTSVPAGSYANAARLAAFNRFNEVRQQAGLGLLRQDSNLDTAAQGHADYVSAHGTTHTQSPSLPGFTGVKPSDRARAAGFADWMSVVEAVMPDPWAIAAGGGEYIDDLMAAPYHRMGLLFYRPDAVGIGYQNRSFASGGTGANVTVKMGRAPGQGAPGVPFTIWPVEGATLIRTAGTPETPNPIPENGGRPYGYPVSVQAHELKTLEVESFQLATLGGVAVNAKLLHYTTDCHLAPVQQYAGCAAYGARYFAALVPRAPLAANTTHIATFRGAIDGALVSRSWTFTTGAN